MFQELALRGTFAIGLEVALTLLRLDAPVHRHVNTSSEASTSSRRRCMPIRVQTSLDTGVTLPLVPTEAYTLEGHEVRLAEQQSSKLIDVELPPAHLLTEPVVPALDIIVGPDGLKFRPTAGWPQPAMLTHVSSTSPDAGDSRQRCRALHRVGHHHHHHHQISLLRKLSCATQLQGCGYD